MRQEDITGKKFNRLTVLEFIKSKPRNKWLCECDCGKKILVPGYKLKTGHTKSCGCFKIEKFRNMTTKHGVSVKSRKIHSAWHDMIARCYNKDLKTYKNYGGRGINVCQEWRDNIEVFHKWCMNNGFRKDLTLDRKDNNGDYSPSNCRWVSQQMQCKNRSTNVFIEHNGRKETLTDTAKRYGLTPQSIRYRLRKGWSMKEALESPKTGTYTNNKINKTI